jgi:parallel beta-helix repeat protein
VTNQGSGWLAGLGLAFLVVAAACSPSGQAAEGTAQPAPAAVADICAQGAERVVERLDSFLDDSADLSPEEFLGQDDIDGLVEFQNEVAQILTETTNENSTLCDLEGLQGFVDAALAESPGRGLLGNYLVSVVRFGGHLERADVAVRPGDDVAQILALLDDGSTMTFAAGIYEFDETLLVARSVVLSGAGSEETIIRSSASDAAIAAFGDETLDVQNLAIEHVGDSAASVVLAVGAAVHLDAVVLSGAVADEENGGGNGLLLSAGRDDEIGPATVDSRIVNSRIVDNMVAGIAVTDDLAPLIENNLVARNALCGICFLERSAGTATANLVEGNEFGIQVGDQAAPMIMGNDISGNTLVGIVLLGTNTAVIADNTLAENGEVAIAVQEQGRSEIRSNTIGAHLFGITLVNESAASVTGNLISDADVGIQVAEQANPTVVDNRLVDIVTVGLLHRDQSTGRFSANTIVRAGRVAVLVEGDAEPEIVGLRVEGAEVGVSYREQAGGTLSTSYFDMIDIGVQIEDAAGPVIVDSQIEAPEAAGIVVRSTGSAQVKNNLITNPTTLGLGVAGDANPVFEGNTVTGGETAASLIEESVATLTGNRFVGQAIAIQVGDTAAPLIDRNDILDATGAAIVYRDSSGGTATNNNILNPLTVGFQVIDDAAPDLSSNLFVTGLQDQSGAMTEPDDGQPELPETALNSDTQDVDEDDSDTEQDLATVAMLYAGSASGTFTSNEILGFVIGVQVGEEARPVITENRIDGGQVLGVGFLVRGDASAIISENWTTRHSIGFQIGGQATAELLSNTVEWAADVAFLVQAEATPTLTQNSCPAAIAGIARLEKAAPILSENQCSVVDGKGSSN